MGCVRHKTKHASKPMNVAEYNSCVDSFSDNIYRFILKNIKNEDKAKDVVQETFTKMWVKVAEVSFEKARSYLFSTAYHTMIDMIRKDKKQGEWTEAIEPSHDSQYTGLQEVLHEAIEQLPEVQRSALMLRDYEGYNYKEIGDMTGLTESQVKVYIYRARKFLQKYIGSIEAVI